MSLDYIKQHYAVPTDIGRVIHFQGRKGVIVGAHNASLKVNFDDEKLNKYAYLHPTWNVEYGEIVKIRPLTAEQKRYTKNGAIGILRKCMPDSLISEIRSSGRFFRPVKIQVYP